MPLLLLRVDEYEVGPAGRFETCNQVTLVPGRMVLVFKRVIVLMLAAFLICSGIAPALAAAGMKLRNRRG